MVEFTGELAATWQISWGRYGVGLLGCQLCTTWSLMAPGASHDCSPSQRQWFRREQEWRKGRNTQAFWKFGTGTLLQSYLLLFKASHEIKLSSRCTIYLFMGWTANHIAKGMDVERCENWGIFLQSLCTLVSTTLKPKVLFFFFNFSLCLVVTFGILVPQPKIEPMLAALEALSLNHWGKPLKPPRFYQETPPQISRNCTWIVMPSLSQNF